jgi:hypothetical protein
VGTGAGHRDPPGRAAPDRAPVQRAVDPDSVAVDPGSVAVDPGSVAVDPGSVAVAAGIAVRETDGSVVFLPPADPVPAPSGTAGTRPGALPLPQPPVAVQRERAADAGAAVQEVPAVQREAPAVVAPDGLLTGTGGTDGIPAVGPAPDQPPGTLPAVATPPPPDLDELARRLFDPLSARLRAELRLDRERAGVVTDLRH